jgi:DnaJ-class molecular chaperone
MIRERLTSSGWKTADSQQLATLDPVCQACGGRGLAKDREGKPDPRQPCSTCGGRGRIKEEN